MENKTTIIKSVKFEGKWVEFIFENQPLPDHLPYHESSKNGYLWDAIESAGLYNDVISNGLKGKILVWKKEGDNPNWEIDSISAPQKEEVKESGEMQEAIEIIQNLKAFGMIHTVTGVVYPEGSHEDFIKRADSWLEKNRKISKDSTISTELNETATLDEKQLREKVIIAIDKAVDEHQCLNSEHIANEVMEVLPNLSVTKDSKGEVTKEMVEVLEEQAFKAGMVWEQFALESDTINVGWLTLFKRYKNLKLKNL